jgi:ferredoxin
VSFLSAADRLAAIDRSKIAFDPLHCLHSLDQFATCDICVDVCPVDAISLGNPPAFDADSCENCFACLPACPTGAYSADDAVQSLLTCAARFETKTTELVCALHEDSDIGIQSESTAVQIRGCLAGLGVGTYLALGALGLEKIILRLDTCSDCPWVSLQKTIQSQVDQANQLLAHWGKSEMLVCVLEADTHSAQRPLWRADNPPLSRRDLFRMAARQGQVAMARMMSMHDHSKKISLGRDRLRLVNAIKHFPSSENVMDTSLDKSKFSLLSVSEKCDACMACARACPTAALTYELDDDKICFALLFNSQICIGCELCMHVCAPNAIEVNQALTFTQVFSHVDVHRVFESEVTQCAKCDALFAPKLGQKLCSICQFRKKNPFGSKIPNQRSPDVPIGRQKSNAS